MSFQPQSIFSCLSISAANLPRVDACPRVVLSLHAQFRCPPMRDYEGTCRKRLNTTQERLLIHLLFKRKEKTAMHHTSVWRANKKGIKGRIWFALKWLPLDSFQLCEAQLQLWYIRACRWQVILSERCCQCNPLPSSSTDDATFVKISLQLARTSLAS